MQAQLKPLSTRAFALRLCVVMVCASIAFGNCIRPHSLPVGDIDNALTCVPISESPIEETTSPQETSSDSANSTETPSEDSSTAISGERRFRRQCERMVSKAVALIRFQFNPSQPVAHGSAFATEYMLRNGCGAHLRR